MQELVTDLQSYGLRVEDNNAFSRRGGAGPAEGMTFAVGNKAVNIPVGLAYVQNSPYSLVSTEGKYFVVCRGEAVQEVNILSRPNFYGLSTKDKTPYQQIALRHGRDCLASTVNQLCDNWRRNKPCSFCAIQTSLLSGNTIAKKTPEQLAEVAEAAQRLDSIFHVVLTTGAFKEPEQDIWELRDCVHLIKQRTRLPVHVQCLPPKDPNLLEILRSAGADSIGLHIETWDRGIWEAVAPGKAEIGFVRYEYAWKKAVELFGANQVSSFLLAGLGESAQSLIEGTEYLADLGVFPYIVPFRPIAGSKLEQHLPPSAVYMREIYGEAAEILYHKGLQSQSNKAGCVRCGACSALDLFEKAKRKPVICHSARNSQELEAAFAIRQQVFVDEQHLFSGTDRDEQDQYSIHLIARNEDSVIGTVRVYPLKEGLWIGGRLAVKQGFRDSRAGMLLVKEAMKTVKKRNALCFEAAIQEPNVPFFRRLGWEETGQSMEYHGLVHQRMRADLQQVQLNYKRDVEHNEL